MKTIMSRAVLAVAAAVAATVTLSVTPALASTSAPVIAAHDAQPAAAQADTICGWFSPQGIGISTFLGEIICDPGYTTLPAVEFPNGTWEEFAIGTSHAIWTAWDNTSGDWDEASLGGLGYSAPWIVAQDGWGLTIGVSSSSGGHYCDNREDSESSGWTGWFQC
jgi:hypothetical protein